MQVGKFLPALTKENHWFFTCITWFMHWSVVRRMPLSFTDLTDWNNLKIEFFLYITESTRRGKWLKLSNQNFFLFEIKIYPEEHPFKLPRHMIQPYFSCRFLIYAPLIAFSPWTASPSSIVLPFIPFLCLCSISKQPEPDQQNTS